MSGKIAGLGYAGRVADAKGRWSDFAQLRTDFLRLDSPDARQAALDALTSTGDGDLRAFATALQQAAAEAGVTVPPQSQRSGESGLSSESGRATSAQPQRSGESGRAALPPTPVFRGSEYAHAVRTSG